MFELSCEYLSERSIWLYFLIMSGPHLRMNRHYINLNVKELLAWKKRDIWSLSDCKSTPTHNDLDHKWTLNNLVKLTKWLSWVESTCLYCAFDFMFFWYHVRVLEWIHTLYLPECQATSSSKQVQYLKFKWLQRDSNPQPLSSWTNTKPFGQTDQMIDMSWEYLSVRCFWLYVLIMSRTRLKMNPHCISPWFSRNSLL